MLSLKEMNFKNNILKQKDSDKIKEVLNSKEIDDFSNLFADKEFMEHIGKYMRVSEEEEYTEYVYLRKK